MAGKKIGVLALQGAFIEHQHAFECCGADCAQVRSAREIEEIDGLVIPGGESTTIGRLLREYDLGDVVLNRAAQGMPIWGTCAGMILLAKDIADSDQYRLGLMDIRVKRNAYGRQVDSFESELDIAGLGQARGVFIRAPYVESVWNDARVLCTYRDRIVMVEQGPNLATAFHPELTDSLDVHKYFLSKM
ncbi:MAG: pyridoxal 5'-phosphate synthase glutaminase subunit PdxT [Deltaproteobacteria bacterium]